MMASAAAIDDQRPVSASAFTLIELLVVVTIIVVLLALLVPALNKAIYQAELAVCGTKQRSIAVAVQVYAANSQRRYPYRLGVSNLAGERPTVVAYNGNPVTGNKEDRPMFRKFLDINKQLNCPLVKAVDIDGSHNDTLAYAPYALWFDWRYRFSGEKGMFRLGDRFTWTAPGPDGTLVVNRFGVLASDFDQLFRGNPDVQSNTHPDADGVMVNDRKQDDSGYGLGGAFKATYSYWATNKQRGLVDNNFAYDDGSVRRMDALALVDPRMVVVPQTNNNSQTWDAQLPQE